jgi:HNH endonuclease
MLTAKRLHELLNYDPATGVFTYRARRKHIVVGNRAGTVSHRYRKIAVDGKQYLEHRLAWFYVYGRWPDKLLDHINMDGCDNRLCNLRQATHSTNKANRRAPANNSTGFKGVSLNKATRRYQASICRQYKQMHLGFFATAEEAHAAYCSAARALFGNFSRTA